MLCICGQRVSAAPFTWSGLYFGGNIGYGWGANSDPSVTFFDGSGLGVGPYFAAGGNVVPNVQPKGVTGGGQFGFNWMMSRNWVLGLVTDFQASGMKASTTNSVTPPASVTSSQFNSVQIDWFGTVRGKAGWAQNNWLLYVTGGFAYGSVKSSGNIVVPAVPVTLVGSDSTTRAGWTLGGGIDFALTPHWTLGAEYLYVDLGHSSYAMSGTPTFPLTTITVPNRAAANIARLTMNIKF